jgi:hypothetical protein
MIIFKTIVIVRPMLQANKVSISGLEKSHRKRKIRRLNKKKNKIPAPAIPGIPAHKKMCKMGNEDSEMTR